MFSLITLFVVFRCADQSDTDSNEEINWEWVPADHVQEDLDGVTSDHAFDDKQREPAVHALDEQALSDQETSTVDGTSPGYTRTPGSSSSNGHSFVLPGWVHMKYEETSLYQRGYYEKLKESLIDDGKTVVKIRMLDAATRQFLSPDEIYPIWAWMFVGGCKLRQEGFIDDAKLWLMAGIKYFVKEIKAPNALLREEKLSFLENLIGQHELEICRVFLVRKKLEAVPEIQVDDIVMFVEMVNNHQRDYYEKMKESLTGDDKLLKIEMLDAATRHLILPDNIHRKWAWMFVGGCKLRQEGYIADAKVWLVAGTKHFVQDIKASNIAIRKLMFEFLDGLIGQDELLKICKDFSRDIQSEAMPGTEKYDTTMFAEMINMRHRRWAWMIVGGCKLRQDGFTDDAKMWLVAGMKHFVQDIKAYASNIDLQKLMFIVLDVSDAQDELLEVCKEFSKEIKADAAQGTQEEDVIMFVKMFELYQMTQIVPFIDATIKTFIPQY